MERENERTRERERERERGWKEEQTHRQRNPWQFAFLQFNQRQWAGTVKGEISFHNNDEKQLRCAVIFHNSQPEAV